MTELPDGYKMVIFDIDGTLYNQKKMRLFMALELAAYYGIRPWRIGEINVLKHFRREREKNALDANKNVNIMENQYKWCQPFVNHSLTEIQTIVETWMHKRPLKYLSKCTYKHVSSYIDNLNEKGVITCAYSDFRGDEKLNA
ncbi:MAG: HAD hydrolase-like protein, partial [Bacteroidia bacterium]|nr:HAD hydrolase-like protein [Bacteroidia bacterium]